MSNKTQYIMTYQLKRAVVNTVSDLLIFIIYAVIVFQTYMNSSYTLPEEIKFWAQSILLLIPIMIISKILIIVVFSIINMILTSEKIPSVADELDRLIELRSSKHSMYAFFICFMLGLLSIVIGYSPSVLFIFLLLSVMSTMMVSNISQWRQYRELY